MSKIQIKKITNNYINKYLDFKNLNINRKYSSNKKKINRLDHYLWWLTKQKKRDSYLLMDNNNSPTFISTADIFKERKSKLIYLGLISCKENINLFDFLKAVKIQNSKLLNYKEGIYFISIDPKNKAITNHWKYFKYHFLEKRSKYYKLIKKFVNVDNRFNIYFKRKSN